MASCMRNPAVWFALAVVVVAALVGAAVAAWRLGGGARARYAPSPSVARAPACASCAVAAAATAPASAPKGPPATPADVRAYAEELRRSVLPRQRRALGA